MWWWDSLGFVSTDDARIRAEIVSVHSELPGRIEAVNKEEGMAVAQGEIMARLDSKEIEGRIVQARADLDGARNRWLQVQRDMDLFRKKQKGEVFREEAALRGYRHNLDEALAHEEKAREEVRRNRELFDKNLIPAQNLEHAEIELRQALARVSALREKTKEAEAALELVRVQAGELEVKEAELQARGAEVRQADARLVELRRKLELMVIRSPANGTVVKKNAHQGEYIQTGQPIFMVVNSDRYWVEANVEETKIRFIKAGTRAIIRVDSYPGRDFPGVVVEVGEATVSEFSLFSPSKLTGVFIKSTQRLPVKIAVENTDRFLKVGMLAVVWIAKVPSK
jgi:membrane fusion protein (multidrug efflux system)